MENFKIIDGLNTINFDNIGDMVGFEYPEISSIFLNVPGRSGDFYVKSDYLGRRLSWRGVFSENGPTNRRDILKISIGGLKTLKFETCDGLTLQAEIELIRVNMPYGEKRSSYLFEAQAPDYRLFDQTLTEASTAPTISIGGSSLPTALPMSFANVSGVPKLELTNRGDVMTPPDFIIHGPGTNFTIQNIETGDFLIINTTITVGETINIYTATKEILLNDKTNIFGTKTGNFWEVPIGTSNLHFVAETGQTVSTMLDISYRSAYKGI